VCGNGLANTFAKVEVSGPTTKRRQGFLSVSRKKTIKKNVRGYRLQRIGEKHEVHPLEGKERGMVHLSQDFSGTCDATRLSRNSSRATVNSGS